MQNKIHNFLEKQFLQLATFLVESVKSGKIKVSQNNKETLEITALDKKIDVNAKDKEFIKDIVASVRKDDKQRKSVFNVIERGVASLQTVQNMQPVVKELADDFCREGLTVTLSFKGDAVVTIGSKANSKFTRFLTGTKGVEINSFKKLVEIGL
jgi:K+/H+ antiporter YhaU regulatory subunit KhtT